MSRPAENKRCPECGTEFHCLAQCAANTCWPAMEIMTGVPRPDVFPEFARGPL